ncbi:MAG: HNH endonuclease [Clostridiales bacterium]|nr:HNH endonuclease [Clostridiales bacterium]
MYKSARSRATDIPKKVKEKVYERDNGCCILCGRPGNPWCHFISRQKGGLGIEQNIVTLCNDCHREYDESSGTMHQTIRFTIKEYLLGHYPNLSEKDLVYKKWSN